MSELNQMHEEILKRIDLELENSGYQTETGKKNEVVKKILSTSISNFNNFLEKESSLFKFKKFLAEIEEGKKGLEIRIHFTKTEVLSEHKLLQWAKKEFGIDTKDQQTRLLDALIKDCLILKQDNNMYKVLGVEERKKLKKKKNMVNSHEFSLNWLMSTRKEKYPRLGIPYIIYYLIEKLKEFGGKESEGIFRLAIEGGKKIDLFEKIQARGFVNLNEPDPNIPAVLLKEIFKKVEPILSCKFYQECIDAKTENDYEKIWNKLPEVNRQVLLYLGNFIQEMTNEKVVSMTKMDLKNLSIVFVPSLVRDDNLGPAIEIMNQSSANQFFVNFMEWMRNTHSDYLLPIDLNKSSSYQPKLPQIMKKKDANLKMSGNKPFWEDIFKSSPSGIKKGSIAHNSPVPFDSSLDKLRKQMGELSSSFGSLLDKMEGDDVSPNNSNSNSNKLDTPVMLKPSQEKRESINQFLDQSESLESDSDTEEFIQESFNVNVSDSNKLELDVSDGLNSDVNSSAQIKVPLSRTRSKSASAFDKYLSETNKKSNTRSHRLQDILKNRENDEDKTDEDYIEENKQKLSDNGSPDFESSHSTNEPERTIKFKGKKILISVEDSNNESSMESSHSDSPVSKDPKKKHSSKTKRKKKLLIKKKSRSKSVKPVIKDDEDEKKETQNHEDELFESIKIFMKPPSRNKRIMNDEPLN